MPETAGQRAWSGRWKFAAFKGEMLLVAHCELRSDRRNFKVDRIVTLRRVEVDAPGGENRAQD